MSDHPLTGRCECGAVRYEIAGRLRGLYSCHCGQCRRIHGNASLFAPMRADRLTFAADTGLKWYRSSDQAERGFCGQCGASLFYRPSGGEAIFIAAGSLDQPTGIQVLGHLFVNHKADYETITDDLPQFDEGLRNP